MIRKPIKLGRPFGRIGGFKFCHVCKKRKECYDSIERRFLKVKATTSKATVYNVINCAKALKKPIWLVANCTIPYEYIWDISYSQDSILQINCELERNKDNFSWVSELVHVAEKCGIKSVVNLHTLIPKVITVLDVIRIIDSLKGCYYYHIVINFATFFIHGDLNKGNSIKLRKQVIPLDDLKHVKGKIWRCSDRYINQFMELIEFYSKANRVQVILCKGGIARENGVIIYESDKVI